LSMAAVTLSGIAGSAIDTAGRILPTWTTVFSRACRGHHYVPGLSIALAVFAAVGAFFLARIPERLQTNVIVGARGCRLLDDRGGAVAQLESDRVVVPGTLGYVAIQCRKGEG